MRAIPMSSSLSNANSPVALRRVPFDVYAQLRRAPENRSLRMTYYNGTLEVMSPQYRHEKSSRRLGLLVIAVTGALGIPCEGAGSTTFSRRGRRALQGWGKEPDESFYLANEARIRGKEEIDLDVDPPPDLWIEVDHRGSSRGRLPLYASLGVPEVWRYHTRSRRLWFGTLDAVVYRPIDRSLALPVLTPALVLEALDLGEALSTSEWDAILRTWVRDRLATR
jgi:Uma2 family endonuclease